MLPSPLYTTQVASGDVHAVITAFEVMEDLPNELKHMVLWHTASQSAYDVLALSRTSRTFYRLFKSDITILVQALYPALMLALQTLYYSPRISRSYHTRARYLRAPYPFPHPGINKRHAEKLLRLVRKTEDLVKLFLGEREVVNIAILPSFDARDELFNSIEIYNDTFYSPSVDWTTAAMIVLLCIRLRKAPKGDGRSTSVPNWRIDDYKRRMENASFQWCEKLARKVDVEEKGDSVQERFYDIWGFVVGHGRGYNMTPIRRCTEELVNAFEQVAFL